jgi:hypothetical protein
MTLRAAVAVLPAWRASSGMLFPILNRLIVAHADVQGSSPPARTWLIDSGSSSLSDVNSIEFEGCRVRMFRTLSPLPY